MTAFWDAYASVHPTQRRVRRIHEAIRAGDADEAYRLTLGLRQIALCEQHGRVRT